MAVDTKAPGQAPPDLPSLLLDGRICYIGMPVSACCAAPFPCHAALPVAQLAAPVVCRVRCLAWAVWQ